MSVAIWPNFFIVGAHKSGTTSLYEYLNKVPEIYMSKVKEPHFFAPNVRPSRAFPYHVFRDERKYLELFRGGVSKVAVGEASTSYLWDEASARLIVEKLPNAKIIMLLRDPIERAFSHYLMSFRGGSETLPFYEALKKDQHLPDRGFGVSNLYVELGLYSEQVKRYLKVFDRRKVKILIFEEFINDTRESVSDVLEFLGIETPTPQNIDTAYNSFFTPRNELVVSILRNPAVYRMVNSLPPWLIDVLRGNSLLFRRTEKPQITKKERDYLTSIYREDVAALESTLKRTLPWLTSSKEASNK